MARLVKLLLKLRVIFMLASGSKAFLFLTLQAIYLRFKGSPGWRGDCGNKVYWLMAALGNSCRSLGKTGLYTQAFYCMMPLIFGLTNSRLFSRFRELETNNFYLFLLGRDKRKANQETEHCINMLINSLNNHCHNLEVYGMRPALLSRRLLELKADDVKRSRTKHQLLPSDLYPEVCQQLEQIRRQWFQLKRAKSDRKLFAVHRTQEWREQVSLIGSTIYVLIAIVGFLTGSFVCIITHRAARYALHQDLSQPLHLRHLGYLDRLSYIEQSVYVLFIQDFFLYPFAFTLLLIWDHLRYLAHLRSRFHNYLQQMPTSRFQWHRKSFRPSNQMFPYEQQTIDLYLEMVIWISDLRHSMGWVSFVMSQYVFCAIMVALFSAAITGGLTATPKELKAIKLATFGLLTIINLLLYLCAAFESSCSRLAQKSWSVIAALESPPPPPTGSYDTHKLSISRQPSPLASPHTLLLWRRLNEDPSSYINRFSCKLFNLINANFKTLMRLNFSCLSLWILAYRYSKHDFKISLT